MSAPDSRRPASRLIALLAAGALLAAVVLVVSACGGGGNEAGTPESQAGSDTADAGGSSDTESTENETSNTSLVVSDDDGELAVLSDERPDWLPLWVLLPGGLNNTAATFTAATGDAFISGTVAGGDADKLYSDAIFMAQSGGYIVSEEFQGEGRGFTGDHSSDGSSVTFLVAQQDGGDTQWGMEFTGLGTTGEGTASRRPAPGASDVGLDPLNRRGTLTLTVLNPRVSSRVEGACSAGGSRAEFLSDDETTRFLVLGGDPYGSGEITLELEGQAVTWIAAEGSEQIASDVTPTDIYYEGDFLNGADVTFGIVQIRCEE